MGATLVWPALAVLGFVAVTGVVIALGTASTARYEFERNGVGAVQRTASGAARTDSHPAGRRTTTQPTGPAEAPAGARARPQALGVATRPAPTTGEGPGWWLVGENAAVLAGPFADQVDADWAAFAQGLPAVAVYGARCSDGSVAQRPSPIDRAWLDQLGEQLDRLPDDWNAVVSDTDPLTTLVVEITAALVEAGLPLHDPDGSVAGVSLLPEPTSAGVLVSWRPHERMTRHPLRGVAAAAGVLELMNGTLADVLAQQGFVVESYGDTGCWLVSALR